MCLLQKAYTTPHFLALSFRFRGKTAVLYVGRGNQYQGIYIGEKMPPTHLRIQDKFLDYVRKYLVGSKFSKIVYELDKLQLTFKFKREGIEKVFSLGWSERRLYFDQKKLDGLAKISHQENARLWKIDDYFESKNINSNQSKIVKKKEKFLTKKIENIEKDIKKNKAWRQIELDLNNGLINLEGNEVTVGL